MVIFVIAAALTLASRVASGAPAVTLEPSDVRSGEPGAHGLTAASGVEPASWNDPPDDAWQLEPAGLDAERERPGLGDVDELEPLQDRQERTPWGRLDVTLAWRSHGPQERVRAATATTATEHELWLIAIWSH